MSTISRAALSLVVVAVVAGCVSVAPTTTGSPSVAIPSLPSASLPTITLPPTPTFAATPAVTLPPTSVPTGAPTDAPTSAPTDAPTDTPTDAPTDSPTDAPTDAPTESPSEPTPTLDFSKTPNYGSVDLESGYTPDPFTKEGITSGGSVDVDYVGCNGFASSAPDFEVDYTGGTVFPMLRFYFVPSDPSVDTTLIINKPDTSYVCGDDYNAPSNRNPEVTIDPAESGTYDIWVGSYTQGANVSGTLYITQLQGNHPE